MFFLDLVLLCPPKVEFPVCTDPQRILNGKPRQPHFGIDIGASRGTKVFAPADGIVVLAEPDLYFSGGTIILDHGHGLTSAFLHLEKLLVKEEMFWRSQIFWVW